MTAVQAAGGVVLRWGPEVVLVHRPKYDDWTLPKGKLEPGEGLLEGALREVREETGLSPLVGPPLGSIDYVDSIGRDKTVHYWAMATAPDALEPAYEVDDARWLSLEDAYRRVSYERDHDVLSRAESVLPRERATVLLVRHAKAGDRSRWEGPDERRPLTRPGWAQAEALARMVAERRPALLVSSPYARCVETLEPLAGACGLPVQHHTALAEGASAREAVDLLEALAVLGPVVACTHGDVQEAAIESLLAAGVELSSPLRFAKGSTWELTIDDGRFVSGRYLPPPA